MSAAPPVDAFYGTASRAYGTKEAPPASAAPNDTFIFGSYGINGYLYYQDPLQGTPKMKTAILGGLPLVAGATQVNMQNTWFGDLTTLDGATVPATVTKTISKSGGTLPPGFGGASSIPAFGDCNAMD